MGVLGSEVEGGDWTVPAAPAAAAAVVVARSVVDEAAFGEAVSPKELCGFEFEFEFEVASEFSFAAAAAAVGERGEASFLAPAPPFPPADSGVALTPVVLLSTAAAVGDGINDPACICACDAGVDGGVTRSLLPLCEWCNNIKYDTIR